MKSWTTKELSEFVKRKDLEGPSQQLRAQGVSGEDFFSLTQEELQHDLRLTPFTARKLARIRDAFLASE